MAGILVLAAEGAKNLCCGAKFVITFADASLEVKLTVLALWIGCLASIGAWVRGLVRLRRTPGADLRRPLAFLAGWRTASPFLAAGVAAYVMMNFFVALYAYAPVPANQAYGPALAEVFMVLWPGFVGGAVAALALAHLGAPAGRNV